MLLVGLLVLEHQELQLLRSFHLSHPHRCFQVDQDYLGDLLAQMNPVHLYFQVVLLYPLVLFAQCFLEGQGVQGDLLLPGGLVLLHLHHQYPYHHHSHCRLQLLRVIQVLQVHPFHPCLVIMPHLIIIII